MLRLLNCLLPLVCLLISVPSLAQDSRRAIADVENKLRSKAAELDGRITTNEQDIIFIRRKVSKVETKAKDRVQNLKKRTDDRIGDLRSRATDLETRSLGLSDELSSAQKKLDAIQEVLSDYNIDVKDVKGLSGQTKNQLDRFWILISAVLVFLMQAGFKTLEAGLVRAEHRASVGIKNLLDWLVVSVAFYVLGFGFMYGASDNGFFGMSMFLPSPETMPKELKMEFFLFQLAFAGTAATIVSGALAERAALPSYLVSSVVISTLVYPLFGHWVWGNLYLDTNQPWLANLGFHDFAGGTVVHAVGGWTALVGVWMILPRRGRFDPSVDQERAFKPSDLGYSILGVFILWAGWWGFNGGSVLAYNNKVAVVILSTNLAGAAAGIAAYLHAFISDRKNTIAKMMGGTLGGLVAITPCCDVVLTWHALVIGVLAGVLHNHAVDLMERWRLDDPVGAVAVHAVCGSFGTICVGLFANPAQIARFELCTDPQSGCVRPGVLAGGGFDQLIVQTMGVLIAFVLSVVLAYLTFKVVDTLFGLRVSEKYEQDGFYS